MHRTHSTTQSITRLVAIKSACLRFHLCSTFELDMTSARLGQGAVRLSGGHRRWPNVRFDRLDTSSFS